MKEDNGRKERNEFGKFKNIDALLKAYAELEAEFTRRSQRLKNLEEQLGRQNQAERFEKAAQLEAAFQSAAPFDAAAGSAQENAGAQSQENAGASSVQPQENAGAQSAQPQENAGASSAQSQENAGSVQENAQSAKPQENAGSGRGETSNEDEALYRAVMQNDSVRARILGDLKSLWSVPLLAQTGVGVTVPVSKPKSFAEAGSLALGYFKSEK